MTRKETIRHRIVEVLQCTKTYDLKIGSDVGPLSLEIAEAVTEMMELYHSKALACHCECLRMNAENCLAICLGKAVPYNDDSYLLAMQKWGLIDEEGKPLI